MYLTLFFGLEARRRIVPLRQEIPGKQLATVTMLEEESQLHLTSFYIVNTTTTTPIVSSFHQDTPPMNHSQ
jgi:hypothetical protein